MSPKLVWIDERDVLTLSAWQFDRPFDRPK